MTRNHWITAVVLAVLGSFLLAGAVAAIPKTAPASPTPALAPVGECSAESCESCCDAMKQICEILQGTLGCEECCADDADGEEGESNDG